MMQPPLDRDLTLASICQKPSIQDYVHGSRLPEDILEWSEDPVLVEQMDLQSVRLDNAGGRLLK
jgi:hypothetical protein